MSEKYYGGMYQKPEPEDASSSHYEDSPSMSYDPESPSMTYGTMPTYKPPVVTYGAAATYKKTKVYDPMTHVKAMHKPVHKPSMGKCDPIVCDPQYVIHDCYVPREVPIVHPIIHVQRRVIVNVPKHYVQPVVKNQVVDPGCPCD